MVAGPSTRSDKTQLRVQPPPSLLPACIPELDPELLPVPHLSPQPDPDQRFNGDSGVPAMAAEARKEGSPPRPTSTDRGEAADEQETVAYSPEEEAVRGLPPLYHTRKPPNRHHPRYSPHASANDSRRSVRNPMTKSPRRTRSSPPRTTRPPSPNTTRRSRYARTTSTTSSHYSAATSQPATSSSASGRTPSQVPPPPSMALNASRCETPRRIRKIEEKMGWRRRS